jgi:glycosyltransferase involved in cell wall biosynthesis
MRILHTAATYSPSLDGVAEVVRNVSERLAKRGHDVHVATATVDSQSSYAQLRGVHVHRFSARGNLAFGLHGEIEKYRRFVRSGNWDIVITHCLRSWPTDALLTEIGSYTWPSVLVTHGIPVHSSVFHTYFLEISRYLATYSKWVCVSKLSGESSIAEQLHLPAPQIVTNGLDMAEWSCPPLRLRKLWNVGDTPWIVNVSNHYGNHHKNHPAMFELARRLKGHGVRVTQIGNSHRMSKWNLGSLGIRGGCFYACRARAMLSGSLDLRTNVPREHVVSAIQEADVFVSTSRWEANSLVLLESMAAGTPWVSFDVGTARQNVGGIVVKSTDEMVEVFIELLRDPVLRQSLGIEGRNRAAKQHDWERITNQYEELYESAIRHQVSFTRRNSAEQVQIGMP